MTQTQRAFFPGHWAWAIPILLIVAILSFRQIDWYTPSSDERQSIAAAGFAGDEHTLHEVAQFISEFADINIPGYFLLLNVWGHHTSGEPTLLRVLSIFVGLLSLSMAYRLGHDCIDPRAGIILLTLVACNAYLNYTYVHLRMYGCVVLASSVLIWLYWRMTFGIRGVTARRWSALVVTLFSLVILHVLSACLLVLVLFAYHALFVGKKRPWLAFPLAIAAAIALASPTLADLNVSALAQSHLDRVAENTNSLTLIPPFQFIRAGLSVLLNSSFGLGQLLLIALPLAGMVRYMAASRTPQPYLRLLILATLGLIVLSSCVSLGLIGTIELRYAASLLMLFLLPIAAGLFAWARQHSWMIIFVAVYAAAGITHHSSGHSDLYVTYGWRRAITQAPLHAISRLALHSPSRPLVFGFQQSPNWINLLLPRYGFSDYREYFFTRHGIQVEVIFESREAEEYINAKSPPNIWVFYQSSAVPADIDELDSYLRDSGYQFHQTVEAGIDAIIRQYSRSSPVPGQ